MKPTPQLFRYVRPLIAISFVVFSFGFLFTLVWRAVPAENKEIILLAAGYLLGVISTIMGYYFGTSKDKSDQEQQAMTSQKVDTAVVNADTATVNTQTTL